MVRKVPGAVALCCIGADRVSNGSATVAAIGQGNMRAYVLNTALTKAPGKVGDGSAYLQ